MTIRHFAAVAALALGLLSQPANAFTFPAADAVETIEVSAGYVGEVWATARTESGDTIWDHCAAVIQSYDGSSSTSAVRDCIQNVADANRTTIDAFERLRIGDGIVLPLTASAAESYRLSTATVAAEPGVSEIIPLLRVFNDRLTEFGEKIDASFVNRSGTDNSDAVRAHFDQSTAALAEQIGSIAPQIKAALSGVPRTDEWLWQVIGLLIVAVLGLIAGLVFLASHRRNDNKGGIGAAELVAVLKANNEELVNRLGTGHDKLSKLANGINEMAQKLDAERDRADRLEELVAELKPNFDDTKDYLFDGKAYKIKLDKWNKAGKWYDTGSGDPVNENHLNRYFAGLQQQVEPRLKKAAE